MKETIHARFSGLHRGDPWSLCPTWRSRWCHLAVSMSSCLTVSLSCSDRVCSVTRGSPVRNSRFAMCALRWHVRGGGPYAAALSSLLFTSSCAAGLPHGWHLLSGPLLSSRPEQAHAPCAQARPRRRWRRRARCCTEQPVMLISSGTAVLPHGQLLASGVALSRGCPNQEHARRHARRADGGGARAAAL